ncbi:hypothetical protein [Methanobrevibacter sp.]|uniref:hypothetical protein n=1 Tax=Methanobrevibacter sp. TaxID=66852 RepID=UPI0025FAE21D|nr:hypothetical protein [Methanobrevibacter sp.]
MRLIEIGIILIVILMIFGVVLSSVEDTSQKIIRTQEINNMEKLTSEILDNLINNPGVPENWNEYDRGTPGLAIVNEEGQTVPNSVSYAKFIALGKNYDKMVYENLFNSKIKSSIELNPQKSSISSVKIGDIEEGNGIFSVNRLVKCDFYKSYVIKDFQNEGKCERHHSQKDHSCNYFKVFPGNFKKSDYYLLVDDNEEYDLNYIVDTTRVVKERYWEKVGSKEVYLNDKIFFYDDDSAVAFVHLDKPHPKAVIICVPKDFDKSFLDYDYFRTNECELRLTAWY